MNGTCLHTPRCILRPAQRADLDALVAATRSPQFPDRLPLTQMQPRELSAWLATMCERMGDGAAALWSIDLVEEERACVGQVSLSPKPDGTAWNLAFWIDPSYWGRGIATEALAAAIDHAFDVLDVPVLHAGVALWNHASMRTVERLGFRHRGDNADGYRVNGAPEAIREYELAPS